MYDTHTRHLTELGESDVTLGLPSFRKGCVVEYKWYRFTSRAHLHVICKYLYLGGVQEN